MPARAVSWKLFVSRKLSSGQMKGKWGAEVFRGLGMQWSQFKLTAGWSNFQAVAAAVKDSHDMFGKSLKWQRVAPPAPTTSTATGSDSTAPTIGNQIAVHQAHIGPLKQQITEQRSRNWHTSKKRRLDEEDIAKRFSMLAASRDVDIPSTLEALRPWMRRNFSGVENLQEATLVLPGVSMTKQVGLLPPTTRVHSSIGGGAVTFHEEAGRRWRARCALYEHRHCPALGKVPTSPGNSSKCRIFGMCVCSRPDLQAFVDNLRDVLRRDLSKKAFCNKFAREGSLVLRLDWRKAGADSTPLDRLGTCWWHLARIHFQSWALGIIELEADLDPEALTAAAILRFIALRVQEASAEHGGWRKLSVTNAAYAIAKLKLKHHFEMTYFEIIEDTDIVDPWVPAQVAVRQVNQEQDAVPLWPGWKLFQVFVCFQKSKFFSIYTVELFCFMNFQGPAK